MTLLTFLTLLTLLTLSTMNEDLYLLYTKWYFPPLFKKSNCKFLSSVDVYDQWVNLWFAKGKKQKIVDDELREFEHLIEKYLNYSPQNLIETIAMVILYDQFPRNIYRGTILAYEFDKIAIKHATKLFENFDLPFCMKLTIIICFAHSEDLQFHFQNEKMLKQIKFDQKCDPSIFTAIQSITKNHKERIELFGRIPERNVIIGRESTEREIIYLKSI